MSWNANHMLFHWKIFLLEMGLGIGDVTSEVDNDISWPTFINTSIARPKTIIPIASLEAYMLQHLRKNLINSEKCATLSIQQVRRLFHFFPKSHVVAMKTLYAPFDCILMYDSNRCLFILYLHKTRDR